MPGRTRPPLAMTGALLCAAAALWASFGRLAFLDTYNRASYVGLLPAPFWLAVLVVLAVVAASWSRLTAQDVAPLWLSAVLLLPWLPVRLPLAVFIWTGHVILWVWVAIVVLLVGRRVRSARWALGTSAALSSSRRRLAHLSPASTATLAGLLSLVAYIGGAWAVAPQHPNGDEPHYLIITQSLLSDHDLQIENNHRQRDYRTYSTVGLKPDFLRRGVNGEIYSIHAPGLPALVAPFFAAFGYPGVVAALVVASAIASGLVWLVAWRVTGDHRASWFAWAAVSFSTPYFS